VKIAKKQQRNNWNKAKTNHNVIGYMNYTNISTDQSNEIQKITWWCYFDSHRNTTRMSNDPRIHHKDKDKKITPITIAPAKVSLKKVIRKEKHRYRQWLHARKIRTWCIKIPEVISEGGEKEYMFCEQQEAEEAEAEYWMKKQSEERQQKLQEKYKRLKYDREQQQQQRKQKNR